MHAPAETAMFMINQTEFKNEQPSTFRKVMSLGGPGFVLQESPGFVQQIQGCVSIRTTVPSARCVPLGLEEHGTGDVLEATATCGLILPDGWIPSDYRHLKCGPVPPGRPNE